MDDKKIISLARYRARRRDRLRPPIPWFVAYRRLWGESLDRLVDYLQTIKRQESKMSDLKFEYPADEPIMVTTRTFEAPRSLVWKVMTTAEHIARWWGPKSIAPVLRIEAFEFRPGGKWRYVCQRPDGSQTIVFYGTYLDVVAPEKFVNTFAVEGMFEEDVALTETHTLEERDGKTYYRAVSQMGTLEARDGAIATGMETGARESLEQLAALVAAELATAK